MWKDKALYDTGSYEDVNGASQRWTMNMTGAQANHMGIYCQAFPLDGS